MYIITEDRFLKCGLEALIEQQDIELDDNDVILDFDNNFIIITTLSILKEIITSDAPFERFLLHSFFKIKKEMTLKELRLRLKYKSWRHRKSGEYALPLTRKERALLTYAINTGSQKDIFSRGELDSKTLSTHKYNMLRKINLQSIATLAQVHLRWKSFPHQLEFTGCWPDSAGAYPAREPGLWPYQLFHQLNTV
ncbi:LuxR C-terminal-related transcriptional regulator [Kosakonia sp. H02]|nr:LuxR C-terminal-related transcriptional regulator [Kosakonia sp. H02]